MITTNTSSFGYRTEVYRDGQQIAVFKYFQHKLACQYVDALKRLDEERKIKDEYIKRRTRLASPIPACIIRH